MSEVLLLDIGLDAREDIVAELGSLNVFNDRLAGLVERESDGRASLSAVSATVDGTATRSGVIEVITAVSGLITALAPIVVAWIRSRGFKTEETTETHPDGTVVQKIRVCRGAPD